MDGWVATNSACSVPIVWTMVIVHNHGGRSLLHTKLILGIKKTTGGCSSTAFDDPPRLIHGNARIRKGTLGELVPKEASSFERAKHAVHGWSGSGWVGRVRSGGSRLPTGWVREQLFGWALSRGRTCQLLLTSTTVWRRQHRERGYGCIVYRTTIGFTSQAKESGRRIELEIEYNQSSWGEQSHHHHGRITFQMLVKYSLEANRIHVGSMILMIVINSFKDRDESSLNQNQRLVFLLVPINIISSHQPKSISQILKSTFFFF